MNVAIVGLGLIGGSLAKAVKKNTGHTVYGVDIDRQVINKALLTEAIDCEITDTRELLKCDIILISLYPQAAVDFVKKNAGCFSKESLVIDCCGVKKIVTEGILPVSMEKGFTYIGGHPMAGVENWGFSHSREGLFRNASMILCANHASIQQLEICKNFFLQLGFTRIQLTTPEEHDKMIALTSQLAHVLSSAYVKSPSALKHGGFSAGSFKDMTRVAKLNEDMWSELFLENRDNLLMEIDCLIERLREYEQSIRNNDREELRRLLKEGREIKTKVDGENK